MKIFNLTRLKSLYVNLIAIAFLLPSLGGVGGGLYAQDPVLFTHSWYLEKVIVNNNHYYLNDYTNYTGTITFNEIDEKVVVFLCLYDDFESDIIFFPNNSFEIFNIHINPFFGECAYNDGGDSLLFFNLYFGIYFDNPKLPRNPFTYTITTVNNYSQLTIENGNGDLAVYNSVLLSTASFSQNSFALYPNPVKETLQINNGSNQRVSATIYDLNGKKLQGHSLETSASTIDVKALNQGVYFVVFESEEGEQVSKKFIKQ